MNLRKEKIKVIRRPINERGFTISKTTSYALPYFTPSAGTARKMAKDIMAVFRERNEEIAHAILQEDIEETLDKFGFRKYPPEERKLVIEGFSLARSYILHNKMRLR